MMRGGALGGLLPVVCATGCVASPRRDWHWDALQYGPPQPRVVYARTQQVKSRVAMWIGIGLSAVGASIATIGLASAVSASAASDRDAGWLVFGVGSGLWAAPAIVALDSAVKARRWSWAFQQAWLERDERRGRGRGERGRLRDVTPEPEPDPSAPGLPPLPRRRARR